jgi:hypothetical protein
VAGDNLGLGGGSTPFSSSSGNDATPRARLAYHATSTSASWSESTVPTLSRTISTFIIITIAHGKPMEDPKRVFSSLELWTLSSTWRFKICVYSCTARPATAMAAPRCGRLRTA